MKGLFIPDITAEMFRNGCLESIESLMAEGEIYDIEYEPEPQWIPCSERLPEPRIDVWCNSDLGQIVGYYDETIEAWYGRNDLELLVNAWMPLPPAYRPEEESE